MITYETLKKLDYKKLTPELKKAYIYWLGYHDIGFFCNYFLSNYLLDGDGKRIKQKEFHLEFLSAMQSIENLVIRFPRNHSKTTNIIFATIHDICYEKENGILFVMQKLLGEKVMNKIRVEFETNQRIISIFGRLVPMRTKSEQNKSWRTDYLMFLNGTDLQLISKNGSIRGGRKTKCYIDDPEEDDEVKNIRIIQELRDWIAGTIMPMFLKGNLKVTGTVVHDECLVNHLYNNPNTTFKKISQEAVSNPVFKEINGQINLVSGEPIRPERLSIDTLNKILLDMQSVSGNGLRIRQREYLHIPFNDRGERVRSDEHLSILQTPDYTIDTMFKELRIYKQDKVAIIGVDTASGRLTGDYSTISVRNIDGGLLAFWYDRGGPEIIIDVLNRIFELGYYGATAIEVNNETGGTTITLARQQRRVNYLYQREDIENITNRKMKKYGWNTNQSTRPTALGEYDVSIRGGKDDIYQITEIDERVKKEMQGFIRNPDSGKREAQTGYHDDGIMADAICWQMRKQLYNYIQFK